MKKIILFLELIFLIFVVSSAVYQEPWIQNQVGDSHNLTDMGWISADVLNGTEIIGEVIGSMGWTKLQNYPVACPSGTYITALNDSVTCTSISASSYDNLTVINLTVTNINASTGTYTNLTADLLTINDTIINSTGISTNNLTLTQKITFALGEIIDNIVDGWFTITGSLQVDGDINMTGNFTGNQIYGGMWYHNHTATELNFASDGVFYSLIFTEDGYLNGFTKDNDYNLTAQVAGIYKANYMASGDGQNNHEYYISIFIDGVNQDRCESHKKMTAGGDIVTMTGNCFINLSVGSNVGLKTADIGGTGIGNYYSSELNLVRIGG